MNMKNKIMIKMDMNNEIISHIKDEMKYGKNR